MSTTAVPEILHVNALGAVSGHVLGPGPWHQVDQHRIDLFAEATGDQQWIHVDPELAAAGPFSATIAHGYLTLSLLPQMQNELRRFDGAASTVNYGVDRVRFLSPVPAGSRVRLTLTLQDAKFRAGGSVLLHSTARIEVEGSDRPACVADTLTLVQPSG
jgi:acyl dehydratase